MTHKEFLEMFGLEAKDDREQTTDQISTVEVQEQGGDDGTRKN